MSPVLPAFPAMLKDLSARDAKLLSAIYAKADPEISRHTGASSFDKPELLKIYTEAGLSRTTDLPDMYYEPKERSADVFIDVRDFDITLGSILRLGIIQQTSETEPLRLSDYIDHRKRDPFATPIPVYVGVYFEVTGLGAAFISACEPPKGSVLPKK
jgi:hypothetical protein